MKFKETIERYITFYYYPIYLINPFLLELVMQYLIVYHYKNNEYVLILNGDTQILNQRFWKNR